jgi:hypothetical protein
MPMRMLVRLLACAVLGATLAACSAAGSNSGLGDNPGTPTGTPFYWPTGITVQGSIYGGATGPVDIYISTGRYVEVYLVLANGTGGTISITLPAGLIFVANDGTVQNGILIQQEVISIPASSQRRVLIQLYCLNASRSASGGTDTYSVGPVTDHAGVKEIISILVGKNLVGNQSIVQGAVWEVTDYGGLTGPTRTQLQGL